MKKHGAVLDMRNDRLSFWPEHYQHDVALRLPAAEPQVKKPCAEPSPVGEQHTKKLNEEPNAEAPHANEQRAEKPHAEEPHAGKPMKILKRPTNELPELLPHFLPSTRCVSKVVNTSKVAKPNKNKLEGIPPKLKPNAKEETKVKDETNSKNEKPSVEQADNDKSLDLAFIGGAPFMHLAKSKKQKAEIFAISM